MGRAWQFFLIVAMTIAAFAYFYYASDFYAKRATEPLQSTASAPAASTKPSTVQ